MASSREPKEKRAPYRPLLALLAALVCCQAAAPAQENGSGLQVPPAIQLLHANTNPTLRLPVCHSSYNYSLIKLVRVRASFGWLEITRDSVRYELVRQLNTTKDPDHGFEASRRNLKKLRFQYGSAAFEAAHFRNFIVYVDPQDWNRYDAPYGKRTWQPDPGYSQFIVAALANFSGAVARVEQYQAKLRAAAAPPPAPAPAPKAVPAPAPAPPPAPPTIVLVDPSASPGQTIQVSTATLKIRGVVMDAQGLPFVSINGRPANMKPRSARTAEFWSDPITLQNGENKFEITATNGSQKAEVAFVAHYTPPPPAAAAPAAEAAPNPKALGLQDILDLLNNFVPSERVADLVKQYGLKFSPTEDDLKKLREAGAGEELLNTVKNAGKATSP